MSCRDVLSEIRFGKQKSLVKVTYRVEEGKQKMNEKHNRQKNTWEKALHRKMNEVKQSTYEDIKKMKFRLEVNSYILS